MSPITLYTYPESTSIAPHILLHEIGVQFETVDITSAEDGLEELRKLNPKARIPVLIIDDQVITESTAIMTAIAQLAPEKHLLGKTNLEVVRVYEWLNWLSGTLHGHAWGMVFRPERYIDDVSMHDAVRAKGMVAAKEIYEMVEDHLRGVHAVGDGLTVVDAFLYVFYRWATSTKWSVEYNTVKRQKLFQNTPKDRSAFPALQAAVKPHIESFNALWEESLVDAGLKDIGIQTVVDGDPRNPSRSIARNRLDLRVTEVLLEKAVLPPTNKYSIQDRNIYPAECRERHATYRGKLRARLQYRINNGDWKESVRDIGQMPIMLRSNRCHLERFSPAEMVRRKEESEELGGYFIVNGNEKLIRMLIASRRNYPMAISRHAFTNRGPTFSKFGIQIRSVRPDQSSQTNVLHYLTDGNVTFRFSWRKNEYLIPVVMILKALVETNDREIAESIIGSSSSKSPNSFVSDRTELLLRTYKAYNLKTRAQTLAYLGEKFRPVLGLPITTPDEKIGEEFLRKIVLPHLGNVDVTAAQNNDKFQLMLFMIRKLYALAAGDCSLDNPDAVSNQEVLLGGFLYGMILKEGIHDWLVGIGLAAREWLRMKNGAKFTDPGFEADFLPKIVRRTNENIGGKLEYFLSTGNLVSQTGLDQSQTSGFTIVAEKINFYRFISHFRCIHRGTFFAQLKTTTVRKLLPESWGFLCPVHTPDGSPCGLLNHLAHQCMVQIKKIDTSGIEKAVIQLGLSPVPAMDIEDSLSVQLDGRILGYCHAKRARDISQLLRHWKVNGEHSIPTELEIGFVPTSNGGLYPGLYLFTDPSRMLRPVRYIAADKNDFVGPFEQQYMNIACVEVDIIPNLTTHIEHKPTNIFSILANMTPFSDFNQSPRNMYQCQMSKQAMGTPSSNMMCRTDNKAYLLQTGQTPVVRPPLYNEYGLDNFPNGMNAVVAVISYTGYDMDDAMIINKSAHERGFGDGVIYKTKVYNLDEKSRAARSKTEIKSLFGFAEGDPNISPEAHSALDSDGLPGIGTRVKEGDIVLAYHSVMFDPSEGKLKNLDGKTSFYKYKEAEEAWIDQVRLIGSENGDQPCQAISIKYRIPRRPIIGDKFSSRHGQKGVCSMLWPSEDMPFSETGIQPDVIINPHAFPSRMTIGMFVESLAGKSGALHGLAQDCTPFSFDEDNTAGNFFGDQLRQAGYNFYGNEPMYSGITGKEFAADIYMGVVYYQRLRHMVSDKFQVRTTGPVNALHGQPIKGRSKGGGIRVGEMERDSLIAHGCMSLLQDRLMDCSDKTRAWVCRSCGSFISTMMVPNQFTLGKRGGRVQPSGIVRCRACARPAAFEDSKLNVWEDGAGRKYFGGDNTTVVFVPQVLRLLDVELSTMGVRTRFDIEN
ncbi:DNA-directed RNA polymerase I subunit RPA2 [Exophiala viscosa]|uniref:DNA-directed RNA polymerase subunit beta n=1 Tax=Exophiala viscosa TaxID=2486360 RepID=A0AAN6DSC7_9EURO|nr:DNA-directed RNA polymerase I subunit RPA2 [Exophiala viscosa]